MQKKIIIGGKVFSGVRIATPNSALLVIAGARGLLGCGYLNCAIGSKLGDAVAVVRGVKSFEDMLEAAVAEVSDPAAVLGVTVGMTGREALERMG